MAAVVDRWYSQVLAKETPDGFWRLGDIGLTAGDETINDYVGTLNGTVGVGVAGWPGDGNTAMSFDGSTADIDFGNILSYTGRLSIVAAVNFTTTAAGDGPIVSKLDAGSTGGYLLSRKTGTGNIRFRVYANSAAIVDITSTHTWNDGAWHLVTAVFDPTVTFSSTLYVDGSSEGTAASITSVMGTSTAHLQIGAQTTASTYFLGSIDEVATFPYALSATAVTALVAARNQTSNTLALMTARSNRMRSLASRSDYYVPLPIALLNGINIMPVILKHTLQATDILNEQADTASFTLYTKGTFGPGFYLATGFYGGAFFGGQSGFTPNYGNVLILADGAANNRYFGGTIVKIRKWPVKAPQGLNTNVNKFDLTATDWTWLLNRYTVTKQYAAGQSGSTVVADLVTNFSHGLFTSHNVQLGAPLLTAPLVFRGVKLGTAISQVCQATSPNWFFYPDPNADIHYFLTETSQNPTTIAPGVYNYDTLDFTQDITQIRTRMLVEGGGSTATAAVASGATSIPVAECSWYSASPGSIITPYGDILTYTGRSATSGAGNVTGVPASGAGAIITPLLNGDQLNVWVQVDDAAAQAALAILELDQNLAATSGVHEQYLNVSNGTISQCTQAADAELAAYDSATVSGTVWSLDHNMRSGKTLKISLSQARGISTNVTIQQVKRTLMTPNKWQFDVTFATQWRNIVDVFRRLQTTQG